MSIERMKGLQKALADKTLTIDEVLFKCAEWTADDVGEYHFKPMPIKPKEVIQYEEIEPGERSMLGSEYFSAHPGIQNYYSLQRSIIAENRALYDWLMESRNLLLKEGYVEAVSRIDEKMKECTVEMTTITKEE